MKLWTPGDLRPFLNFRMFCLRRRGLRYKMCSDPDIWRQKPLPPQNFTIMYLRCWGKSNRKAVFWFHIKSTNYRRVNRPMVKVWKWNTYKCSSRLTTEWIPSTREKISVKNKFILKILNSHGINLKNFIFRGLFHNLIRNVN